MHSGKSSISYSSSYDFIALNLTVSWVQWLRFNADCSNLNSMSLRKGRIVRKTKNSHPEVKEKKEAACIKIFTRKRVVNQRTAETITRGTTPQNHVV